MTNNNRDIDNLSNFLDELRRHPDDRAHISQTSRELRVYVENCYRLVSGDVYRRVLAA